MYFIWYIENYVLPLHRLSKTLSKTIAKGDSVTALSYIIFHLQS